MNGKEQEEELILIDTCPLSEYQIILQVGTYNPKSTLTFIDT